MPLLVLIHNSGSAATVEPFPGCMLSHQPITVKKRHIQVFKGLSPKSYEKKHFLKT